MSSWQTKGLYSTNEQGMNFAQENVIFFHRCSKEVAWDSVDLSFEYFPAEENIVIEIDPWYFILGCKNSRFTLSRYNAYNFMYAADVEFVAGQKNSVKITCNETHAEICVNGKSINADSPQAVRMTFAYLHFPKDTIFSEPEFDSHTIAEPHAELFSKPADKKQLEFTVDFYDDLMTTPFDQDKLDGMFNSMADMGARQAYQHY